MPILRFPMAVFRRINILGVNCLTTIGPLVIERFCIDVMIFFICLQKTKKLKKVSKRMRKHEQQANWLEKISNFFGVSNFLRLNNYEMAMKKLMLAFFALCTTVVSLSAEEIPLTAKDFILGERIEGKVKYHASFDSGILTIIIPPTPGIGNATYGARLNIPHDKLVGMGVRFRGEVRYENITSDVGGSHWGAKIMATNFRQGVYNFFVTPVMRGTKSEWQPISLECVLPKDQQSAHVIFGIQQGWGKIEFRNLVYEVFPIAPITKVKVPANFKQQYTARVTQDVPRRGVMSPPWTRLTEQDIHDLAAWNANLIRYQIVDGCSDINDIDVYKKWFNSALDHLDSLMPLLEKYDIKVIVDMHAVVGGRYGKAATAAKTDGSHFRAMHEAEYRNAFIECWQYVAERFKDNTQIYAYDLCNEPIQHGAVPYSFWDLQYDTAKAIRAIDPEVPIMVQSNHMASPIFFEMEPMPLKNIIFSVHMYAPGEYTHQGVNDTSYTKQFHARQYDYRNAGWNRARLAKSMEAVRKFQQKYGAQIQVGEFSVAIWAPGGASYLDELASIFEEYKWDWTYHAFREWDGWSLEHEGTPVDIKRAKKDTDRKQVMLKYFNMNKND
eukprot:TRINITY_DN6614_c0_g4_i2.p1 TRINITY_DN6614_c0_g4~~TRINITY_DN6614_c0_g4_i2.p1  ORF type:complete len:611 (-),score=107.01 TRINITY_DN6614_c0_g4_i2:38-1870(-)